MKKEAEREQRQREKKQQKKDLSAALRKNLKKNQSMRLNSERHVNFTASRIDYSKIK